MTDEEVQESVARAEAEWEWLKDRVHDQYEEIEELKKIRQQMAQDLHDKKIEIEQLTKENEELRKKINKAIRKLSSAVKHYKLEDKNNALLFAKRILKGDL